MQAQMLRQQREMSPGPLTCAIPAGHYGSYHGARPVGRYVHRPCVEHAARCRSLAGDPPWRRNARPIPVSVGGEPPGMVGHQRSEAACMSFRATRTTGYAKRHARPNPTATSPTVTRIVRVARVALAISKRSFRLLRTAIARSRERSITACTRPAMPSAASTQCKCGHALDVRTVATMLTPKGIKLGLCARCDKVPCPRCKRYDTVPWFAQHGKHCANCGCAL